MVADRPADRIYAFTKFVAALLGAVVFFAFCVLYFFPTRTKQLFAWPIAPPMTAMFIGASYANGVIFFASVLAGKKWHRIWAPHVGVFVFATLLLVAPSWGDFSRRCDLRFYQSGMAHPFLAVESNPTNNAGDDVVLLDARSRSHHRAARTALVGLANWFNRRDRLARAHYRGCTFAAERFPARF